jgi:RNA recognition motif-containing protein
MGIEVYVGHLSATVTEDEIRKMFSVAGTVQSVHLVKNSGSGELRGCGYVRMSTEDEACDAIGLLNGALLGDSLIVVKDVTKQIVKQSDSPVDRGRKPAVVNARKRPRSG